MSKKAIKKSESKNKVARTIRRRKAERALRAAQASS